MAVKTSKTISKIQGEDLTRVDYNGWIGVKASLSALTIYELLTLGIVLFFVSKALVSDVLRLGHKKESNEGLTFRLHFSYHRSLYWSNRDYLLVRRR